MRSVSGSASIRRRKLGHELRRHRERAGLDLEQVARATGWSTAKVSRLERARAARPAIGDIERLLDIYEIEGAEREALVALAREARKRGWWDQYSDVLGPATFAAFEAEATVIRTWTPLLVPGLLQDAGYASRAVRAEEPPPSDEAATRMVEARMTRQVVLERPHPPTLWAIVDEAALRFADSEQLRKLVAASERPHITIQVLRSKDLHVGMYGPFALLEFTDHAPVAFLETIKDTVYLDRPEDMEFFENSFGMLNALALGAPESAELLAELREARGAG